MDRLPACHFTSVQDGKQETDLFGVALAIHKVILLIIPELKVANIIKICDKTSYLTCYNGNRSIQLLKIPTFHLTEYCPW